MLCQCNHNKNYMNDLMLKFSNIRSIKMKYHIQEKKVKKF